MLTLAAPAGVILVGQPSYDVPQDGVLSVKDPAAPQGGTLLSRTIGCRFTG